MSSNEVFMVLFTFLLFFSAHYLSALSTNLRYNWNALGEYLESKLERRAP